MNKAELLQLAIDAGLIDAHSAADNPTLAEYLASLGRFATAVVRPYTAELQRALTLTAQMARAMDYASRTLDEAADEANELSVEIRNRIVALNKKEECAK